MKLTVQQVLSLTFLGKISPQEAITSERAKLIHDWILSLAKQKMTEEERDKHLIKFLNLITPKELKQNVEKILEEGGVSSHLDDSVREFYERRFHSIIYQHCFKLFKEGNYFHAVFEAAKIYNKLVKEKAKSSNDGFALMMETWAPSGVLKVTKCETETDKNIQDGLKFLSAGLMQAIRNPTAHEPALHWPISKEDCLDLLSFISFLLRQLDKAVYFKK